mgnify:CR=1 FL=1
MNFKQLYNSTKKKIAWFVVGSTALAAPLVLPDSKPVYDYVDLAWEKPVTDEQWAEDVKKEQLHTRFDYQLQEMKESHEAKLIKMQELYDKATLYPDAIRWELKQNGIEEPELTKQVNEQTANTKWEYEKLQQSIERINKEIELRSKAKVDRKTEISKIQPSTPEEKAELELTK